MRVIIYRRQSLDRDGNELGIERQLAECQRYATARGWSVVDVVTDNNVSASRGVRSGYQTVLERLERGEADGVLVLRLDRLLRRLSDLEQLIELCERRGVIVATVEGDLDLTSSSGRLVGRILASVARSEVEVKSARHKLANRQKAASGKPHGSRRPFGYQDDQMTLKDDEAAILREFAAKLVSGWSYKELAYYANEQGWTTTTGRAWLPVTIRNMMSKPRYGGVRTYRGEVVATGLWQPVFTQLEWERLQAVLKARRDAHGPGYSNARYLLTGLAVCGSCGLPLNGATKRDRPGRPLRRTYFCRTQGNTKREGGCGGVTRNADALEAWVRDCVLYRLDSPELASLLSPADDGELKALLTEREALTHRLNGLVDDYASGLLTREQLARAKATAEGRLSDVEAAVSRLRARLVSVDLSAGQTLLEAWNAAQTGWRRQLLELVVKRVVVSPGTTKPFFYVDGKRMRFDPKLVAIEWSV